MNVLLASNNSHKLTEFRGILEPLKIRVVSPYELRLTLDVPETAATFAENARIKAEAFSRASGQLTVADDSGLSIRALNGEPGVLSARWGGPGLSDMDRVRLVLERMKLSDDRSARFTAAIAVAAPGLPTRVFEACVEGEISRRPTGRYGFGYDPIFYYPPLCLTFAQMQEKEKSGVSHRGKALRAAAVYLAEIA